MSRLNFTSFWVAVVGAGAAVPGSVASRGSNTRIAERWGFMQRWVNRAGEGCGNPRAERDPESVRLKPMLAGRRRTSHFSRFHCWDAGFSGDRIWEEITDCYVCPRILPGPFARPVRSVGGKFRAPIILDARPGAGPLDHSACPSASARRDPSTRRPVSRRVRGRVAAHARRDRFSPRDHWPS